MKKILFAAYSLELGGIERALVSLINNLIIKGYDITLVLEKKQGILLKELDKNIKIVEYLPNKSKNIIKRKTINLFKRIKMIFKFKNKFDFSACFATYSIPASFIARISSRNSCLWGHAAYLALFNGNIDEMKKFFIDRKYNKFKNIIFVSEEGKNSFIRVFPDMEQRTIICNNLIDYKKIKKMSNEIINLKKDSNVTTFLNVSRHDEKQKKISRIIKACKILKEDGEKFRVLLVGDGEDMNYYKDMVKQYNLNDNIIFLGKKQNPYPYFKISDCVILTSDYEGYPVVFLESFILNVPIITTKVSDYKDIQNKFGYITTNNIEDISEKMKLFIKEGYKINDNFNPKKYNDNIIRTLEKIFRGDKWKRSA